MTKTALLAATTAVIAGLNVTSGSAAEIEHLNSDVVLPEGLPFSEIVRVDDTLYISGQIGNKPGTLELIEGGIEAEAKQVMDNIQATLEAHDYSMDDVVKCLVMLEDMAHWPAFNEIYKGYFTEGRFPARSAFGSSGLAVGALVEVECTAIVSSAN